MAQVRPLASRGVCLFSCDTQESALGERQRQCLCPDCAQDSAGSPLKWDRAMEHGATVGLLPSVHLGSQFPFHSKLGWAPGRRLASA